MPFFPLSLSLSDAYGRTTKRSFLVEAADFASAQAGVIAFVPDYQAVTELLVYESRLTDRQLYAGVVTAGANKDEGMTVSVQLDTPGKTAALQVPGPIESIRNSDGTIDITAAAMVSLEDNFLSTGTIRISDGETSTNFIKATLDV